MLSEAYDDKSSASDSDASCKDSEIIGSLSSRQEIKNNVESNVVRSEKRGLMVQFCKLRYGSKHVFM